MLRVRINFICHQKPTHWVPFILCGKYVSGASVKVPLWVRFRCPLSFGWASDSALAFETHKTHPSHQGRNLKAGATKKWVHFVYTNCASCGLW